MRTLLQTDELTWFRLGLHSPDALRCLGQSYTFRPHLLPDFRDHNRHDLSANMQTSTEPLCPALPALACGLGHGLGFGNSMRWS